MNRKQYFALQIMCLAIMLILIGLDSGGLNYYLSSAELTAFDIHEAINDSFRDMGILISFLVSNVFMILGLMEKKK